MGTVSHCRIGGVLAEYETGFREQLASLGYTPSSVNWKVNEADRLSRWMSGRGLAVGDLDGGRVAAFLVEFGATRRSPVTRGRFEPLFRFLRATGAGIPEPVADSRPLDLLLDCYRSWMIDQRGLAGRTIGRHDVTARRFLTRYAPGCTDAEFDALAARSATDFLLGEAGQGLSSGTLGLRASEVRCLLRFLYATGRIAAPLTASIPAVPGWRAVAVPPRIPAGKVRDLLDSCDRVTVEGVRNYAMLTLLARLGLRAAEVAGLAIDDVHWRVGELTVRGKSRRVDRLPIPADVGDAVARYLVDVRPRATTRAVFVTLRAPRGPLLPAAVSQMVRRQCRTAGITPVGAHALRHALATDLLDRGVRLAEIGQLLRHADLAATAVYAKVDYQALRELAPAWTQAQP